MDIKPIKIDSDYRMVLKEIETLMTAAPDTPEGEKLDVLVTLVEADEWRGRFHRSNLLCRFMQVGKISTGKLFTPARQ